MWFKEKTGSISYDLWDGIHFLQLRTLKTFKEFPYLYEFLSFFRKKCSANIYK